MKTIYWCTTHDDIWGEQVDWAYRDDDDETPVFCYSAHYNGGKADCRFVQRLLMPVDETEAVI